MGERRCRSIMSIKITGIFVWITLTLFTFLFLRFLRWGHSQHVKERERLSSDILTAEQAKDNYKKLSDNNFIQVMETIKHRSEYSDWACFATLFDDNIKKLEKLGYKVTIDDDSIYLKYKVSWSGDD